MNNGLEMLARFLRLTSLASRTLGSFPLSGHFPSQARRCRQWINELMRCGAPINISRRLTASRARQWWDVLKIKISANSHSGSVLSKQLAKRKSKFKFINSTASCRRLHSEAKFPTLLTVKMQKLQIAKCKSEWRKKQHRSGETSDAMWKQKRLNERRTSKPQMTEAYRSPSVTRWKSFECHSTFLELDIRPQIDASVRRLLIAQVPKSTVERPHVAQ